MQYVRVSILPCPKFGPSVFECIGVCVFRRSYAYYLYFLVLEQFVVVCLCKRLYPVDHGNFVNPVFNAAKSRLRWNSVQEHSNFAESVEIMPAEFYYIGASDASVCPSQHQQHYAVVQTMPDVPFTRPPEIGDR